MSSFCELKLGVEESDEKRGTSEVLRERPCSLRWLAATWGTSRISTKYGEKTEYYWITYHLCYGLLCVFPEIALQKLNEQKDIFTLGDWLVPALMGKRDVKSIWRKIQDHGWWQNDRNLQGYNSLFEKINLCQIYFGEFCVFLKKWAFSGCSGGAMGGHFGPEHAPIPHCDDGKRKL